MKKKVLKKKKPTKQKIDVVIESLVNLEQRVKELIKTVNQLDHSKYYKVYPDPKHWPKWNPPEYN